MIALSIRQPWAWLITRPDITDAQERLAAAADGRMKTVENRTWHTHVRGDFLIHASKGMTGAEYDAAARVASSIAGIKLPPAELLERGGIVGQACLVDCVRTSSSPWWAEGSHAFVLRDAQALPFMPCLGQLSFFDVPFSAIAAPGSSGQQGLAAQGGLF